MTGYIWGGISAARIKGPTRATENNTKILEIRCQFRQQAPAPQHAQQKIPSLVSKDCTDHIGYSVFRSQQTTLPASVGLTMSHVIAIDQSVRAYLLFKVSYISYI